MKKLWILLSALGIALVLAPLALAQETPVEEANDSAELIAFNGLVAIVLPWLLAIVFRMRWSAQTKEILSFGAAGIVGLATTYYTHGLHFDDEHVYISLVTAITVSKAAYEKFKPLGLDALEEKTG